MAEKEKKQVAKKVVPAKETAKKQVEVKEEAALKKEPEVKETPKTTKPKLTADTDIEVMNNTTGYYGYIGKSGFAMDMSEYGDILEIPFSELKRMRAEQPRHLTDAFIVVLNDEAVKELRLEKIYEGIVNNAGLDELLADPKKLKEVIPKMPSTMRETISIIARRKFRTDELYDNRIKKVIEEGLNIKIDN